MDNIFEKSDSGTDIEDTILTQDDKIDNDRHMLHQNIDSDGDYNDDFPEDLEEYDGISINNIEFCQVI